MAISRRRTQTLSTILIVWHFQERLASYFWNVYKGKLTIGLIYILNSLFLGILRIAIYKSASQEILDDLKPTVVILPEFNIGYFHNLIEDWCHRNNVPLLIIPYTTCGAEEWMQSIQSKDYFGGAFLFNWLLKKTFHFGFVKVKASNFFSHSLVF